MTEESKSGNEETETKKKEDEKDEKGGCKSQENIVLQSVLKDDEDSQDRTPEEDQMDVKQGEKTENSDDEEQESESSSSESESDSSKLF